MPERRRHPDDTGNLVIITGLVMSLVCLVIGAICMTAAGIALPEFFATGMAGITTGLMAYLDKVRRSIGAEDVTVNTSGNTQIGGNTDAAKSDAISSG